MTKSTKKNTSTSQNAPVMSKAALRKVSEIDAIVAVREAKRASMTKEDLAVLVNKLDKKILMAKQAAMISAFYEVEVVDAD